MYGSDSGQYCATRAHPQCNGLSIVGGVLAVKMLADPFHPPWDILSKSNTIWKVRVYRGA